MHIYTCADCIHYRRHYIRFDEFRFTEVPCGHCVFPRLKHRKPHTPACNNFKPRKKETDD